MMSLDAINVSTHGPQPHGAHGLDKTAIMATSAADSPPLKAQAIDLCIHDFIQHQARSRPDAPALCAWDGGLTRGELDRLSTLLAGHLASLGVGPESVVPLCFEKTMWTTVAMLSVLKAGGAFVLLDPGLPTKRLQRLCQQVGAATTMTSQQCEGRLAGFTKNSVTVDKPLLERLAEEQQEKGDAPTPVKKAQPSDAAYIIFTSGSTGEPKGCIIEHRSYSTTAVANGPIIDMNEHTRSLQFSSYSFAGAIVEMLMTLMHGGCVCVVGDEERGPSQLPAAVRRLGANWAFLTSTVLGYLSPDTVPTLKTVCVGGEPVRSSQIKEWSSRVHLRQTYGSAETGAYVCSTRLSESSPVGNVGSAAIGTCWIVDPADPNKLLPPNTAGEILIEGPTIGRAYIGEPEKSAKAFIEAPAWRAALGPLASSSRFYRTGDVGILGQDGAIELLGRRDTQVKLRGQRIEFGEIEHQARQASEAVGNAAVELTELELSQGREAGLICFFVVASQKQQQSQQSQKEDDDDDEKFIAQKIRTRLEAELPHYMVPAAIVPIPAMPLTPSGKTDRRRLREMGAALTAPQLTELQQAPSSNGAEGGARRQPQTDEERTLRGLWAQVLSMDADKIGLDDGFFRLGGNSIAVMKLVGAARKVGVKMAVADVFQNPVLEAQAKVLAKGSM